MWAGCEFVIFIEMEAGRKTKRATRSAEFDDEVVLESVLIKYLVSRFVWGYIAASEIQTIVSLLAQDLESAVSNSASGKTVNFPQVTKVKNIGSHGNNPNTCHRDLMKVMQEIGICAYNLVPIPLKCSTGIEVIHQAMIFPHELFASLYSDYRDMFYSRLIGSAGRMRDFWSSVKDTVQFIEHPVKSVHDYMNRCIPLVVHSDGVPCLGIGKSWNKLFDIYSWGSMLATDGSCSKSLFCHTAQCTKCATEVLSTKSGKY